MTEGPSYRISTGSSGRRPWLGLVAAVLIVAAAVVKPWAGEDRTAALPSVAPEPSPAPVFSLAPALAPTAAELAEPWCNASLAWMIYTYRRQGGDLYYVWTVAQPVPFASADPMTIPYTRVSASQLMGFGYCADSEDVLRPGASDAVTIWRVEDGLTLPVPVIPIAADLRTDFGALLRTSKSTSTSTSAWPAGRYLIRAGATVLGAEVFIS